MIDDPLLSAAVSALFAIFFGAYVFRHIEEGRRRIAALSLFLFGVSFAMALVNLKDVAYGPDLRGVSEPTQEAAKEGE